MRISPLLAICCLLVPGALSAQNAGAPQVVEQKEEAESPLQITNAELGAWDPGTDDEIRWLVLDVTVTNTSSAELLVPVRTWRLNVADEDYSPQPLAESSDGLSVLIGGEFVDVSDFVMSELKIPAGKSARTWLTFSKIPAGTNVPEMTLACQPNETLKLSVDLKALYAERLGLSVERLGPGQGLVLLQIKGKLGSINVGTLADTLDTSIEQGLSRFVVSLDQTTEPADVDVLEWLRQVARSSGLDEMYHHRFPSPPTNRITVHMVNPESNDDSPDDATNDWWERNIHDSLASAVIAAIRPLCRQAPRGALLQEIRSGHPLSRQAVLIGGAQKLATGDLPLIFRLTNDKSLGLRHAAVSALRHFGEDVAIGTLTRLAGANDADLATAAVESLAASRYSVAHTQLANLLKQNEPGLRSRVLAAMAETPRPVWSEPLYQLASGGDRAVRAEVLSALTAVGHPGLPGLLRDSLRDADASLSAAALAQLMKRSDSESEQLALQWTLRQLETTPPSPQVLSFLKRMRDARAIPLLMKHLGEPSKQRLVTIQTILAIGDERAAEELGRRFKDLSGAERKFVIAALHAVGSPMFRQLAEQIMKGKSSKLVDHVAELLSDEASPWAVDLLSMAMSNATKKKRFIPLCQALATIGLPQARTVLRQAAGPDAERFRGAAKQALEALYLNSPAMQFVIQGMSAYQDEDNLTLALLHFELAVEVDPELPYARQERGNMILRLPTVEAKRLQDARTDFAKLLEIDPTDTFGHTGLSLVDVRLGHLERGIQSSEKLRESHRQDPLYLYNMACIYGRAIESLESQDDPPQNGEELINTYRQKALDDLRSSIANGLDDYNREWMTRDPDLKTIQSSPDFEKLFESGDVPEE